MALPIVHPLVIESLTVDMPSSSELRLAGRLASVTAQADLKRHLSRVHDHVVAQKCATFTVDVRSLSFVNSSALRLFVDWIARAEQARYKLAFLTEREITWHRLSFAALKSLAPSTVEIVDQRANVERAR
jgi:hypothetical protein